MLFFVIDKIKVITRFNKIYLSKSISEMTKSKAFSFFPLSRRIKFKL